VVIIYRGGKHPIKGLRLVIAHVSFRNILGSYAVWLFATRTAKLLPHLWHSPQHIIFVPAFILFGYYFSIMKLYALFTLHEASFSLSELSFYFNLTVANIQTGWGTRAGIGDASAATAAADQALLDEKTQLATAQTPVDASPFADPPPVVYRDGMPYAAYADPPFQEQVQISPFNDPVSPYQDRDEGNGRYGRQTTTPLYAQYATTQRQERNEQYNHYRRPSAGRGGSGYAR
jgi:hypothetical protein